MQAQILQDPHRGDRKRGALREIWVEKFKAESDQWLVAYIIDDKRDIVYFVAVGRHENFYRDLQRHLERGGKVEKPLESAIKPCDEKRIKWKGGLLELFLDRSGLHP